MPELADLDLEIARDAPAAGSAPAAPDLARLKWIDPADRSRFTRTPPGLSDGTDPEQVLDSIARLTDAIFDDLSIFGEFRETTARGATRRSPAAIDCAAELAKLHRAERALWDAHRALEQRRDGFMQEQLAALPNSPTGLHIGSANFEIDGWINIDAGGGDLALNVNWGLPFADNSIDFLFCSHMVEHLRFVDQAPDFLRETVRVLKPGATARFVVPDLRKLLTAYVAADKGFFADRQHVYPLSPHFLEDGVATLDYVLLYCGVGPQALNYNHKFGYDSATFASLLTAAGFAAAHESTFQGSTHPALRIDDCSFDATAARPDGTHFSLFIEAVK